MYLILENHKSCFVFKFKYYAAEDQTPIEIAEFFGVNIDILLENNKCRYKRCKFCLCCILFVYSDQKLSFFDSLKGQKVEQISEKFEGISVKIRQKLLL